jgi:hypothetical protein
MNKIAVVIGSVAILGIGAYFYLKPKAKAEDTIGLGTTGLGTTGSGTTGLGTTGSGTTGSGTTGSGTNSQPVGTNYTSPEQVAEDVKKTAEATALAKQIDAINTKINNLKQRILNTENVVFKQQIGIQIVNENKKLVPLVEKLKDLGYTESYGIPVKIR